MAKKSKEKAKSEPLSIRLKLFAPGMSLLHRVGLGGLACTLRHIEQAYRDGTYGDEQVPGTPWSDDEPPWTVEPTQITLQLPAPNAAGEFLKRLFALAFQIDDSGLVCLPGQYRKGATPSREVLAELQQGMTLSFIQHGKTRTLAKEPTVIEFDVGQKKQIRVEYKPCSWFKHQDGWKELIEKNGCLTTRPVEVIGPLSPGAVVRHVAYSSSTKIEDPVERVLPLYFALVGALTLAINRGCGVLVIPEVEDLTAFCFQRPEMTPTAAKECRIASAGDAALQAQLRLKLGKTSKKFGLLGCHAVLFRPTSWGSQQKSRVSTLAVPAGDEVSLKQFQIALDELSPRVATTKRQEKVGKGKKAQVVEHEVHFFSDSIVRPLVADNLARGQPWYRGFVDLMTKLDPVSKKPFRPRLFFEKEGLKAMTEKIEWRDQGEGAVVRAVHESLRRRFGAIASENKGKLGAMKNRMSGEFDKWRLAFAGAKTADQFRHAICDLFSRSGMNSVLRTDWQSLLPWLSPGKWQLTRDLALLALASYSGTGEKEIEASTEAKAS